MNLFKNFKTFSVIGGDEFKQKCEEVGPRASIYLGTAALVAGGIMLAKKTMKASDVIAAKDTGMAKIAHATEISKNSEGNIPYTDDDIKNDTIIVYRDEIVSFAKLYIAPVLVMAMGVTAIMYGTGKMTNKITALTTETAGLLTFLNQYRQRVIGEVGTEKERALYLNEKESEDIVSTTEDGKTVKGKTHSIDKSTAKKNPMTVEWGEYNWDGSKNSEFEYSYPSNNFLSAKATQLSANRTVDCCGIGETVVIKVEDILKQHGIPASAELVDRAWVISRDNEGHLYSVLPGGYNYVDLGIDIDNMNLYVDAQDLLEEEQGTASAYSIMFIFSGTVSYSEYLKTKEKGLVSKYKPVKIK
jgi:hypothetical protein